MTWSHGYHVDSGGYVFGHYQETMPTRLRFAALCQGFDSPAEGFRYLDLGCGQGFNLLIAAACHPDSQFVGVDFMPEHVVHGNRLARESGLTNVQFVEADFVDLGNNPTPLGGNFDFIVAHGITAWISGEVSHGLYSVVGKCLNPGGIFYNSYNTQPGWIQAAPFQHTVMAAVDANLPNAVEDARKLFVEMEASKSSLFQALPGLTQRLKKLEQHDPAYLYQEYANSGWQPKWVNNVHAELQTHKLSFVGSATLPECFEQNYPKKAKELFEAAGARYPKELIKDLLFNQSFRRDLFVKGAHRLFRLELQEVFGAMQVQLNRFKPLPEADKKISFVSPTLTIEADAGVFRRILDVVAAAPAEVPIKDIAQALALSVANIAHPISLLLHGGHLHLVSSGKAKAQEACQRFNAAVARSVCLGAPYRFMASPVLGEGIAVSETDLLQFAMRKAGIKKAAFKEELHNGLQRLGRQILKEGKPVSDAQELAQTLGEITKAFEAKEKIFAGLGLLKS
jgi:SAM-dependent methyltransferase